MALLTSSPPTSTLSFHIEWDTAADETSKENVGEAADRKLKKAIQPLFAEKIYPKNPEAFELDDITIMHNSDSTSTPEEGKNCFYLYVHLVSAS